jgi:hemerythrin-like domain-containing protein
MAKATSEAEFAKLFVPENITSEVYGPQNLPKDWADVSLLIPHECIRREMQHMLASIDKLCELSSKGESIVQPWKTLYFCEWFVDILEPFVHKHHKAEEDIYFPWLKTKAEIPGKKFSKDHGELIDLLNATSSICVKVINKKGLGCWSEIEALQPKMHKLAEEMSTHMMEEERDIPPLARENFTEADEKKVTEKILRKAGLGEMRCMFPSILSAVNEWGTPAYAEKLKQQVPPPLLYVANNYYVPDHETYIKPKRDAPLLETKPHLSRKGCFGISFCFPCIM